MLQRSCCSRFVNGELRLCLATLSAPGICRLVCTYEGTAIITHVPVYTTTCDHHCTGPAAFGAALEARGAAGAYPGALPPDPWDDDSSSGTTGSPRGSENGFQSGLRAPRPPAAPHAPAGPAVGLGLDRAVHAPAAADAGASAAAAAAPAALPAPVPLTQGGLDTLARTLMRSRCITYKALFLLWHCLR